ncbi:alpha-ketoacid dehydrogenase subunit beta [Neobacillus kokaensis]|uniref:TPP-dependent acetoin dehydrogenase complex, E1 protein subunit beta n=1 Tax=Neobacillus kokaensis TaxID=2759023 RepID=A0ABQ3N1W2_9BACI|nr:alpha-ketoacid dehydrogenase subunit beta [Neobacillus kokaensis]GHH98930.1 TPP-dependent acetoin dehydrogenase complex, E1 protein subunit beta [Neobacillus kokaensis]
MREITYSEAIREAMSQEMRNNQDVFIMGEDIGVYGGAFGLTNGMIEEFGPERVRITPISEAAISGCAVGAAMTGMRPILEIQFSDFIMIAMDNIVNQAAKNRYMFGGKAKVPVVVRLPGGSGAGFAAQHSQSLEAWMTHVPGLKVVQPSNAYDAKGLMKAAIKDDNPVLFYEHKMLYPVKGEVPEEEYEIPLGKADIKKSGTDISIVATGIMVNRAMEAAAELENEGINVEVIDPRTLVPLDTETILESVKKTSRVLVVYEAVKRGGYGAEIASMIAESDAFDYLDAPIRRLGGVAAPIPYNPELEKAAVPQVNDIIKECRKLMNK